MRLLAIDPGIDITGYAVFEIDRRPRTINEAVRHLREPGELTSSSSDPLGVRLCNISLQLRNVIAAWEPDRIIVEVPAYHGSYSGGPERRRNVNKLYMAIGAILARTGTRSATMRALQETKTTRHRLLELAADREGVTLPSGPRGGVKEDQLDAIWLGVQYLLEGRWGDTGA